MKRSIIIFLLTFFSSWVLTSAQGLSKYASRVEGLDADKVAVYIEDLRSGDVVLDINGEEPMIPASITKVFTTATAFQKCDINSSFLTEIVAEGTIADSVLNGNLVINAVGDPTIESDYFPEYKGVADSIAVAVQMMGVKIIEGKILYEFPDWLEESVPDGWSSDDVNWPYGAGHHALNYADNRFVLSYSSKDVYSVSPATPSVGFKPCKSGSVSRDRDSKVYNVNHRGRKPLNITLANPDPASSFIAAIENSLNNLGIEVVDKQIKAPFHSVVYTHVSPTLYEIMRSLILRSDNQMAEAILRYTWQAKSRSEACQLELDHWAEIGIQTMDNYLEDGSGLSRNDRLTAYSMADLLIWMFDNDNNFVKFLNMMPVAGKSGTLKSFLKDTPLEGMFKAKTGSLNGVQCYAGYAVDSVGMPTHVVVIMVNGFKDDRSKIKSRLEELLIEKIQ